MSSLARRTLRTTAAAAGIAALGAGLAGNAVAAPAIDSDVPAPEAGAALQGLTHTASLAELPNASSVPSLSDLPMLFVSQGPTVRTAAPSDAAVPATPALPGVEQIPGSEQVPGLDAVPTPDTTVPIGAAPSAPLDGALDGVALPAADRSEDEAVSSAPAQVGALSALDTAGIFGGLAQERLVDQQGFGMSTDRVGDVS
jgi:hypothetical protein